MKGMKCCSSVAVDGSLAECSRLFGRVPTNKAHLGSFTSILNYIRPTKHHPHRVLEIIKETQLRAHFEHHFGEHNLFRVCRGESPHVAIGFPNETQGPYNANRSFKRFVNTSPRDLSHRDFCIQIIH